MKFRTEHVMIGGLQDVAFHEDGSYRMLARREPSPLEFRLRSDPQPVVGWDTTMVDWDLVHRLRGYANPLMPDMMGLMRHSEFTERKQKMCPPITNLSGAFSGLGGAFRAVAVVMERASRLIRKSSVPLMLMEGRLADTPVAKRRFVEGPKEYARLQDDLRTDIMRQCRVHRRRQARVHR